MFDMIKNTTLTVLGKKIGVLNLPYSFDEDYGIAYNFRDMTILEDYIRESGKELQIVDFNVIKKQYEGITVIDIVNKERSKRGKDRIDIKR